MTPGGRPPEDRTSGLTGGPTSGRAAEPGPEAQPSASAEPGPVAEIDSPAEPYPSAEPGTTAPHGPRERPLRLQALAGLAVHGSDDRAVGRVRDIYQLDASGALAAITVMPRQLSAATVLIPAAAIEALPPLAEEESGAGSHGGSPEEDAAVRLRVDAATARAGRRPPETAHVTPQDLREAVEALGLAPDDGTRADDSALPGTGTR